MIEYMIDLRSDTVTKPSKEMLNVILESEVGDEYKEDPTVNDLKTVQNFQDLKLACLLVQAQWKSDILLNHTNPVK